MIYRLMWSAEDKTDIALEMSVLRNQGHDEELSRLLAFMASVAEAGPKLHAKHVHIMLSDGVLHSASPFGEINVFYAYESPPITSVYILGFCLDADCAHFLYTVMARANNVP